MEIICIFATKTQKWGVVCRINCWGAAGAFNGLKALGNYKFTSRVGESKYMDKVKDRQRNDNKLREQAVVKTHSE